MIWTVPLSLCQILLSILLQYNFVLPNNHVEKGMMTHSSIVAWRIPWTEEPGELQSMGSQRVTCNWATKHNSVSYHDTYFPDKQNGI